MIIFLLFSKAKDVLKLITDKKRSIDALEHEVIGKTRVLIDGDSKNCRRQECNMGNLICDAIIDYVSFLINLIMNVSLSLPLFLIMCLFFAVCQRVLEQGWMDECCHRYAKQR